MLNLVFCGFNVVRYSNSFKNKCKVSFISHKITFLIFLILTEKIMSKICKDYGKIFRKPSKLHFTASFVIFFLKFTIFSADSSFLLPLNPYGSAVKIFAKYQIKLSNLTKIFLIGPKFKSMT